MKVKMLLALLVLAQVVANAHELAVPNIDVYGAHPGSIPVRSCVSSALDRGDFNMAEQIILWSLQEPAKSPAERFARLLIAGEFYLAYKKQPVTAKRHYQDALALAESKYGPKSVHLVSVLASLSYACMDLRQYTQAQFYLLRAKSIMDDTANTRSINYVSCLHNLAEVHQELKQAAKCKSLRLECALLAQKVLGPNNLESAIQFNNLSDMCSKEGSFAAAEKYARKAVEIVENIEHVPAPIRTACMNTLAHSLAAPGRNR